MLRRTKFNTFRILLEKVSVKEASITSTEKYLLLTAVLPVQGRNGMMNTENDTDMLKPVRWLLDKRFYIPKYQRGYRWTEREVNALLDDIYEFCNQAAGDSEFYCLQPLVVKKGEDDKWNVIDGQQRLTTIVLLVKYFNEMWIGKQKEPVPVLEYQTRERSQSFIEGLEIQNSKAVSKESIDANIDFYYMAKAYETINEWVEKHNKSTTFDRSMFQSVFLQHTKVIWYEIDTASDDEISSFIRINSGKISLNNAELIKALFLQKKNFIQESNMTIHRYEMAEDWDRIEHRLQDNSFWYFITKESPPAYSRINIIFNLLYENETGKSISSNDESFTTYRFLSEKANQPDWRITKKWEEIKCIFDTLCEWYDNYEWYHCIGYLIYTGQRISDLYKLYTEKKKDEAFIELKKLMLQTLPSGLDIIETLDYGMYRSEILRKFYLLYNILYLLKNKSMLKFPFDRFKTEKWDIEHIDSKTENTLKNLKEQKEWLGYALADFKDELKDLKKDITAYCKLKEEDDNKFNHLYNAIIGKISDSKISNKDSCGNLTLLDSGTNRAYGNALFPTKRRFIIERDKKGIFIPPCTKNVFLKYYQENTVELRKWTQDDADKYKKNIEDVFTEFFTGVKL